MIKYIILKYFKLKKKINDREKESLVYLPHTRETSDRKAIDCLLLQQNNIFYLVMDCFILIFSHYYVPWNYFKMFVLYLVFAFLQSYMSLNLFSNLSAKLIQPKFWCTHSLQALIVLEKVEQDITSNVSVWVVLQKWNCGISLDVQRAFPSGPRPLVQLLEARKETHTNQSRSMERNVIIILGMLSS